MTPLRRDFGQRRQNEGTFLKARVRQQQALRQRPRRISPQRNPLFDGGRIGQDTCAIRQEIEVANPWPPPFRPLAAERRLDRVKTLEHVGRRQVCIRADRTVHEIGTVPRRPCGRTPPTTARQHRDAVRPDGTQRRLKNILWTSSSTERLEPSAIR